MKPTTKKYAKGGKVLKMAAGGLVPATMPVQGQQPSQSAASQSSMYQQMTGAKPMTQIGDAVTAQKAMDAYRAASPNMRSSGQSMQPPGLAPRSSKPAGDVRGRSGMPPRLAPRSSKPAGDVRGRSFKADIGTRDPPALGILGSSKPAGDVRGKSGMPPVRKFKKGGMVTSSVRPRGASGRGVKACKIS